MLASLAIVPIATAALGAYDFGLHRQQALEHQADDLFGIGKPIADTATPDPNAVGAASVKLASGLRVKRVLRGDIAGPDGGRLVAARRRRAQRA